MRAATTREAKGMAEDETAKTLRGHLALALARLAHVMVRLGMAALLFGLPALLLFLLWRWLSA